MLPLIAIPTDICTKNDSTKYTTPHEYIQALIDTLECIPILIPSLGSRINLDSLLDSVSGVLLTGSKSNVCPSLYNDIISEENAPYDTQRDATTIPLIQKTIKRKIPLLAICRGMQELNVALGGTLETEIHKKATIIDHRCSYNEIEQKKLSGHPINIEPNSYLENILGKQTAMVNSFHRQAIGKLSTDLQVEARASDNIIEAVSLKNSSVFTLGVQWHPERMIFYYQEENSKKIFHCFAKAVQEYAMHSIA